MKLLPKHGNFLKKNSPMSSHLYPSKVENCGSNSRLVVDEDDNGKFRIERVKLYCIPPSLLKALISVLRAHCHVD